MLLISLLLLFINSIRADFVVNDDEFRMWFAFSFSGEKVTLNLTFDNTDQTWVGVGYGGQSMDGTNCVIYTEADGIKEYQLFQHGQELTNSNSWSCNDATDIDGNRTYSCERSVVPSSGDFRYIFHPFATGQNTIWARGQTTTLQYHGPNNRKYDHVVNDDLPEQNDTIIPTPGEANDINVTEIFGFLKPHFDVGPLHKLIATTARLIFHDCGGPTNATDDTSKCDGCIDWDNGDHAGLPGAVVILESVYQDNGYAELMSRADFWATAATLAIQYAQRLDSDNEDSDKIQGLPFFFGRTDCVGTDDVSKPGDVDAAQKLNPKAFPNAKASFVTAAQWFADEMGFSTPESAALLGIHTLGLTHPDASGFGLNQGTFWVAAWDELDNDFYVALQNQNWAQQENNNGLFQWFSNQGNMMLNADFGLYFNIDKAGVDCETSGSAFCNCAVPVCTSACSTTIACPETNVTRAQVDEYADDNSAWLNDFAKIFLKLVTTGLDVPTFTTTSFFTSDVPAGSSTSTTEPEDGDSANQMFNGAMTFVLILISSVVMF